MLPHDGQVLRILDEILEHPRNVEGHTAQTLQLLQVERWVWCPRESREEDDAG